VEVGEAVAKDPAGEFGQIVEMRGTPISRTSHPAPIDARRSLGAIR
jgi:hypothetical protein